MGYESWRMHAHNCTSSNFYICHPSGILIIVRQAAAEKPFLDMAMTNDGHNALVTSTDRTTTLYDFRASTIAAQVSLLHAATPSCVSLGESENQAVTGAYDGIVRLWDMRSTKAAMAAFKAWDGTKKVLSVDWKRGMVGVGGEGGFEVWKVGEEKVE